jgi:hypothetical protein
MLQKIVLHASQTSVFEARSARVHGRNINSAKRSSSFDFQSEQKRFLQQHKQRSETYSKAAATMKKQRKKNKGTTKTGLAMDKELKVS